MENDVHVQTKSLRERANPPKDNAQPQLIDFADRAYLDVKWFDRVAGEHREFSGTIRVLSISDLIEASAAFNRVITGVPYETIPPEVRNRLWPQAKLIIMFKDQPGGLKLVDACDVDRALLASIVQEVERLEADCFRHVLGPGEGDEGAPRVVVATRRAVAASTSAAVPR